MPLMQSVGSGCSCHLPGTVKLCSTDAVAVGAVGDGWILPRKHSSSMENIAQISSSCYGVSVHFLRKILLWYSSCTDQSIFLKSVSLSVSSKCQILQNKPMFMKAPCSAHSSLQWQSKAYISILDFSQFILLSQITVPKHFQKVSNHKIFHKEEMGIIWFFFCCVIKFWDFIYYILYNAGRDNTLNEGRAR